MSEQHPPEVRDALLKILAYTLNNGLTGTRYLIPEVRYEDMELGDWVIEVKRASKAGDPPESGSGKITYSSI